MRILNVNIRLLDVCTLRFRTVLQIYADRVFDAPYPIMPNKLYSYVLELDVSYAHLLSP